MNFLPVMNAGEDAKGHYYLWFQSLGTLRLQLGPGRGRYGPRLPPQLEGALLEAAYQVMWDHDFTPLISLKVFDAGSFAAYREKGFSFYRKVAADQGIAL